MSALLPTNNTSIIIDEFIAYATAHLATVSGVINTISLYPPLATPGPGVLPWSGYTVAPSQPSPTQPQQQPQSNNPSDVINGNDIDEDKYIFESVKGNNDDSDVPPGTFGTFQNASGTGNYNPPKGGGFSPGFDGAVSVDFGKLDLSAEWTSLASKFIAKFEGFVKSAVNDEGTPRLGFGSDKIIDSTSNQIRDVRYGDTTTKEAALKVLQYEVSVSYLKRMIGSGERKISQSDFDKLNNKQKAACLSYVYNVGSLSKRIAGAIREGNYANAANFILNGPVRGAQSGKIYPGLVERRKSEASLFSG